MVTHNAEMSENYSSRVIRLLDGEVLSDSNPISEQETQVPHEAPKPAKLKKTSMSLSTATSLSFKNLLTKRGRTIITAFAGSIGIIGVALVLALSSGLSSYISDMQSQALAGFPISITTGEQAVNFSDRKLMTQTDEVTGFDKYTSDDVIYRYDSSADTKKHTNVLTPEYLDYISKLESALPGTVNTISYAQGVNINLLAKGESSVVKYSPSPLATGPVAQMVSNSYWQEMPDNSDFILSLYDLIGNGSRLPTGKNEVALVVDEYNRVDEAFFQKLGIFTNADSYKLEDFIGKTILKVVPNNDFYTKDANGIFVAASSSQYEGLYDSSDGTSLTITGILRLKDGAASSYLSPGIVYTTALTDYIVENAKSSDIAIAQAASDTDVVLNVPFASDEAKQQKMMSLGAITSPTGINIYPKDFASKDSIKSYLEAYNTDKATEDQVIYSDLAETITGMIGTLINTITYVLIGFAAISLLVSTIMIGIITYVSVIERTKEIGILRSVGARKKDVSRVFNAETLIIGFAAGTLGVGLSYLLMLPINSIIAKLVGISGIAELSAAYAIILIAGSMVLTFIAGLVPARMAAKKDPVVALRTE